MDDLDTCVHLQKKIGFFLQKIGSEDWEKKNKKDVKRQRRHILAVVKVDTKMASRHIYSI